MKIHRPFPNGNIEFIQLDDSLTHIVKIRTNSLSSMEGRLAKFLKSN